MKNKSIHLFNLIFLIFGPLSGANEVNKSTSVNPKITLANKISQEKIIAVLNASEAGDLEKVKILIAEDNQLLSVQNNKGFDPLSIAISAGHEVLALYLITAGAPIDRLYTSRKENILFEVCRVGSEKILTALLKSKKELVNQANTERETPLFAAVKNAHSKLVELLLRAGAKNNIKNTKGQSPSDFTDPVVDTKIYKLLNKNIKSPTKAKIK